MKSIKEIVGSRQTYSVSEFGGGYGKTREVRLPNRLSESTVAGSKEKGRLDSHCPTLDIDFEATLVPSSTPGHYHLYLDRNMSWKQYKKLLKALMKAQIIEKDYYKMCVKRKESHVRLPDVKKGDQLEEAEIETHTNPNPTVIQALKSIFSKPSPPEDVYQW